LGEVGRVGGAGFNEGRPFNHGRHGGDQQQSAYALLVQHQGIGWSDEERLSHER
jgi:hypothetical protein